MVPVKLRSRKNGSRHSAKATTKTEAAELLSCCATKPLASANTNSRGSIRYSAIGYINSKTKTRHGLHRVPGKRWGCGCWGGSRMPRITWTNADDYLGL